MRLGRPFVGVTFARASQHGEAWLIGTDDGSNTYCPFAIDAPWNEPLPAGTLVGDSLQIVLPARGLTRVLSVAEEGLAAAHSSGLCAALREGGDLTLCDPIADTSQVVLSPSSELAARDMPAAFF